MAPNPGWQDPKFDDSRWPKVTNSFGPKFWKLGPLPENVDATGLERQLVTLDKIDPAVPVELDGRAHTWHPYAFSWRWGVQRDPGHQGYHGLKGEVSDEFIALGRLEFTSTSSAYQKEPGGSRYYLWTSVASDRDRPVRVLMGGNKPASVWINQASVDNVSSAVRLKAGSNPMLLRYDTVGRGFVVLSADLSDKPVDESPVFSPVASWIWHPDDQDTTVTRYFRKTFAVAAVPARTSLRITCDNGYTAFLNAEQLGTGNAWQRVQEYDVTSLLKRGPNAIAVTANNGGGPAGLIAELTMIDAQGKAQRIGTDATWRCARSEHKGWREAGFADAPWTRAEQVSSFADSLWASHPMGPPVLEPPVTAGQPVFQPIRLSMTWYRKPGILPLDTRPQTERPAGWYRFTSPPGLRGMTIAARGTVRAWAGGKELEVEKLKARDRSRATVANPAPGCVKVALRVQQQRGCYGGAALPEPISLDCAPGVIALGDWSQIDGLASYSGGAWYRKTVTLSAGQIAGAVRLDLGSVVASAEVRVNGRPAGIRVAPPWTFDIAPFVRPGENRIEVLVYNTLANHYSTIPTRYRGSAVSGLLGPVHIETSR